MKRAKKSNNKPNYYEEFRLKRKGTTDPYRYHYKFPKFVRILQRRNRMVHDRTEFVEFNILKSHPLISYQPLGRVVVVAFFHHHRLVVLFWFIR